MSILSREDVCKRYHPRTHDVLFIPEESLPSGITLQYFVYTPVIPHSTTSHSDFWVWNANYLKGYVRCMSSSLEEELWGFTDDRDINFFLLKWL